MYHEVGAVDVLVFFRKKESILTDLQVYEMALGRENQLDTASLCRSGTTRVSSGTTSMVREVHKAGVCRAKCLQEEHKWQSKSGASLEQDSGLNIGPIFGIRQNIEISVQYLYRHAMDESTRCGRKLSGLSGMIGDDSERRTSG